MNSDEQNIEETRRPSAPQRRYHTEAVRVAGLASTAGQEESLKGFTRTMLDGEVSGDERREFLSIMWHQAEELHALIEDLIAFSLLGSGRLTVVPESVDVGSTVHRVLQGLAHRSPPVGVDTPTGLAVEADPLRLRQILRNLIDNGLSTVLHRSE